MVSTIDTTNGQLTVNMNIKVEGKDRPHASIHPNPSPKLQELLVAKNWNLRGNLWSEKPNTRRKKEASVEITKTSCNKLCTAK